MNIQEAKKIFINYIKSYCAPETVVYYNNCIDMLQRFYGDKDLYSMVRIEYVDFIAFLRSRGIKNTSVITYNRGCKVFLRYLHSEGYMLNDVTAGTKLPKEDSRMIIPLSQDDVEKLLQHLRYGSMTERNTLIFRLMLDCGLRCGEVCRLNYEDVDVGRRCLHIRNSKNNKSRLIPMPDIVIDLVKSYMNISYFQGFAPPPGAPLIRNRDGKRMTENCIKLIFSKLKVVHPDVHAHLLRHTFATSYIMGGGSLEGLRILLGHNDYGVTRQYLHLGTQMQLINFNIYRLATDVFTTFRY